MAGAARPEARDTAPAAEPARTWRRLIDMSFPPTGCVYASSITAGRTPHNSARLARHAALLICQTWRRHFTTPTDPLECSGQAARPLGRGRDGRRHADGGDAGRAR